LILKIWILQTGEPLQIDSAGLRPMRAMNLSQMLVEKGHSVTIWSSDFDHFSKKHRYGRMEKIKYSENLDINLIPSRGYQSNVGFSRLIDHAQMGFNLRKMLKSESPPDIAFLGFPPIETSWVMSRWLTKNKIKFILDVKDAWPEVLLRAFPKKLAWVAKIFLSPYFLMRKQTFKKAYSFSAPTEDFLNWCLTKCKRSINLYDTVTPLTSPNTVFSEEDIYKSKQWLDKKGINEDNTLKISFIGSLNSAFDFEPVFYAAKLLNIQFIIAGDGPYADYIKKQSMEIKNIKLLGWISAPVIKVLSERSTLMIAPLKDTEDFAMSVPNKFYDAMSNSRPMLTSISGSAAKLIDLYSIGILYLNSPIESLYDKVIEIIDQPNIISLMSNNATSLFNKEFTFSQVYGELTNKIEAMKHER
jgi:glycosyltransferase involved in cell wall biosynthesis